MTEPEWKECGDPDLMKEEVLGISERKIMLFACACCYRVWHAFDETCRRAIEAAERFADGRCGGGELRELRQRVLEENAGLFWPHDMDCFDGAAAYYTAFDLSGAEEFAAEHAPEIEPRKMLVYLKNEAVGCANCAANWPDISDENPYEREGAVQAALLRDIAGNPFSPTAMESAWLTTDVTTMAETIYNDRAFDLMPILGDALEDAGCRDAEILAHCRSGEVHVRGCWVVDGLLGKS